MLKTLNEWAAENNHELLGMQTLYDEELITQQVNDWLNKLAGLCSPVPSADRPELVEQIVKAVRNLLN